MAICTLVCAMLLTIPGPPPAAGMGLPAFVVIAFVVCAAVARFVFIEVKRTGDDGARRPPPARRIAPKAPSGGSAVADFLLRRA
jgi:hypothetical protein